MSVVRSINWRSRLYACLIFAVRSDLPCIAFMTFIFALDASIYHDAFLYS